jgi:sugar/nucleoside kinase (ribokinase family)
MKDKSVVVAGHICLDVLPNMDHIPPGQFESLFKPGHLIVVGEAIFATGGPVSNVGLALYKLGIPIRLIAKTGNDPHGRIIRQIIQSYDPILLDGIGMETNEPTSYTVIISPPGVDRIFLHCSGVNDLFSTADIDYDLVADADLMHFGYPPIMRRMYQNDGAELEKIFCKSKHTGVTTSLDMAFPDPASVSGKANWRKILQATLPYVDIFTPSVEEILFMLHREQFDEMVTKFGDMLKELSPELLSKLGDELLDMGVKIVLLKLGQRGAYLRTAAKEKLICIGRAAPSNLTVWADQELWSPCYQVDVAGTTGSGDATIAGFLCAILRGLEPKDALNAAVAVGACNVEKPDALSGVRSWEETLARIRLGWEKHKSDIQAQGWNWDNQHALWSFDK